MCAASLVAAKYVCDAMFVDYRLEEMYVELLISNCSCVELVS